MIAQLHLLPTANKPKPKSRFNLLCKLKVHKYSKWDIYKKGNIVNGDNVPIAHYITMTRTCEHCGKLETRTHRT